MTNVLVQCVSGVWSPDCDVICHICPVNKFELCLDEKVKVFVSQSCLTLWSPMDYSLPGSSVHGILYVKILEWVAIAFSRVSSQPRDWTQVSCIAGRFFTIWATREAQGLYSQSYGFSSSHVRMWELDHEKAEHRRTDTFQLWGWRRLLRVPWTARWSNQSILKEINPEYSF